MRESSMMHVHVKKDTKCNGRRTEEMANTRQLTNCILRSTHPDSVRDESINAELSVPGKVHCFYGAHIFVSYKCSVGSLCLT